MLQIHEKSDRILRRICYRFKRNLIELQKKCVPIPQRWHNRSAPLLKYSVKNKAKEVTMDL